MLQWAAPHPCPWAWPWLNPIGHKAKAKPNRKTKKEKKREMTEHKFEQNALYTCVKFVKEEILIFKMGAGKVVQ